jgi:hypothetical protein
MVSSLAPHDLTHLGMIEKAPYASKQEFVEIFRQSVRFWRVRCRAGELNALLTQAAVEIITDEFCRIVSAGFQTLDSFEGVDGVVIATMIFTFLIE